MWASGEAETVDGHSRVHRSATDRKRETHLQLYRKLDEIRVVSLMIDRRE